MSEELTCVLRMPNQDTLLDQIRENSKYSLPMLTHFSREGKSVNIYGAGPSLGTIGIYGMVDEAWACNSALPFLKNRRVGVRCTHGFVIDQGVEMLSEWGETFPVHYYTATSVHPGLTAHLLEQKRKVSQFHNYLGIRGKEEEEFEMYKTLYPTEPMPDGTSRALMTGHGLNSVVRATCLALGMGFTTIRIYGADSAAIPNSAPRMPDPRSDDYRKWLGNVVMYADGRTALQAFGSDTPFCEAPDLDGRMWHTRPDMVISAQHLLQLQSANPGKIEIMGDVLPNVLRDRPDDFMALLPKLTPTGEVTGFGNAQTAEEPIAA